jgi:SPP1 gp7 family putative phage head morphogenesis protein
MQTYSMAKISGRKKGDRVILPPVNVRLSAEKQYYAALRLMLTQAAAEVRQGIIPKYQSEQAQNRLQRSYQADASNDWFITLKALVNQLQRVASDTVNRILNLEAERHTDAFMASAKRSLGIDLKAVVRQEDLDDYMRAATARNTSLITSLGDDVVKRVEQTVYSNSIAGNSATTLRKALQEQFGITDRRAKLIARDQTSKFNADLNKIRQQQAGVTSYSWMTAHDERVRPLHRSLDGKTYKWGEATGAEQGLPPGQPILCRCVARGIVEF